MQVYTEACLRVEVRSRCQVPPSIAHHLILLRLPGQWALGILLSSPPSPTLRSRCVLSCTDFYMCSGRLYSCPHAYVATITSAPKSVSSWETSDKTCRKLFLLSSTTSQVQAKGKSYLLVDSFSWCRLWIFFFFFGEECRIFGSEEWHVGSCSPLYFPDHVFSGTILTFLSQLSQQRDKARQRLCPLFLVDQMVCLYGEEKLNFKLATLTQLFCSDWNVMAPKKCFTIKHL